MDKLPALLAFPAALLLLLLAVPAHAGPGDGGHDDSGGHGGDAVEGPEMLHNDTWSYTFIEEGVFEYHCHPHPWMQATITVLATDGAARNHTVDIVEPEDYEQWDFAPEDLTVRVGDTVTWVNAGAQMHKVAQTTAEHAAHVAGAGSTVESTSGHEDTAPGTVGNALAYIAVGLVGGVAVAWWVRRQSP